MDSHLGRASKQSSLSSSLLHAERKEGQGEEGSFRASIAVIMKLETTLVNLLFEKRPNNFGMKQDIQSKRDFNGSAISNCSGKGLCLRDLKCFLQLTSSLMSWTVKQQLAWPTSTNQRQNQRRGRECWPALRRKLPAKQMSLRSGNHPSSTVNTVNIILVKNKKVHLRWLHLTWILIACLSSCLLSVTQVEVL